MSEKFEIKRNEQGLKIRIFSPKVEQLFRTLSQEQGNSLAIGGITFNAWYSEGTEKFIRSITDMFTAQAQTLGRGRADIKEEELLIPSFRNNILFQNNQVGINLLLAQGIGNKEGKEFQIGGMYSIETTKKIAMAFKKAMDYLVNESAKTVTIAFDVVERKDAKKEEAQILEFNT